MLKNLFFIFIVLIGFQVKAADINKQISDIQEKTKLPGLQVMVYEGDKILFEYAQGLRATGQAEKITANDIGVW